MYPYHATMNHDMSRPRRAMRILMVAVAGVVVATGFALLFGWLVLLLWNWLMPMLFGLQTLSYWQAFGITILSKILFSGVHPPYRSPRDHKWHRERFHHWMCGEDAQLPEKGNNGFSHEEMRHYRTFWKEEGEAAFREYLQKRGVENDGET